MIHAESMKKNRGSPLGSTTQYGQSQSEKELKTSQLLLPQHQSTYPRGLESASIEFPSFRPHFIKFSKTVFI